MKSISITPFYGKSKEHVPLSIDSFLSSGRVLPLSVDSFRKGKEAKYHLLSIYVQSAVAVLHALIILSPKSSSEVGLMFLTDNK